MTARRRRRFAAATSPSWADRAWASRRCINALVGQKISITSKKPQQRRYQHHWESSTDAQAQFVFVDTPGFQTQAPLTAQRSLESAPCAESLAVVDAVVFVLDATRIIAGRPRGRRAAARRRPGHRRRVNKVDLVCRQGVRAWRPRGTAQLHPFAAIVPVSAEQGHATCARSGGNREVLSPSGRLYPSETTSRIATSVSWRPSSSARKSSAAGR
jgi:GTPase Era involved in 16S rRNA processing